MEKWKDGIRGTDIVVKVHPGEDPKWDKILTELGYGDVLEFSRVVEFRAWEVFSKKAVKNEETGKWEPGIAKCRYIKGKAVHRRTAEDQRDVDRLSNWILKNKPPKRFLKFDGDGDCTLMVFFSDWQLGKREGGGTVATLSRIEQCLRMLVDHVQKLRKLGISINRVVVCGMGDIVEACSGHYPMQAHMVDAHMRKQRFFARRVLIKSAIILRPHFKEIIYRAVPGNHGEEREQGKAYTHFSDNNDVCIFDQFKDVVENATWSDGIEVHTTSMDDPQLTMCFEELGVKVGLAHGHQGGSHSRGDPDGKVKKWFERCAMNRHPIGQVDILNTGHYHHHQTEDLGAGRSWKQCPTLDGGSFWYWSKGGAGSVAGMLTYLIDPSSPRGWDWERVLTPRCDPAAA